MRLKGKRWVDTEMKLSGRLIHEKVLQRRKWRNVVDRRTGDVILREYSVGPRRVRNSRDRVRNPASGEFSCYRIIIA